MPVSHATPRADQPRRDADHLKLLPSGAGGLPDGLVARVDGHLARFAEHLREGLLAASVAVGLEVMDELMAAEVSELAGPRGRHDRGRTAMRHGTERGAVTLGGRRLPIRRPRVRTADGSAEVPLATYGAFSGSDLLADGIVARMLAGLSTRRYAAGLEPVGAAVEARAAGTSRSAVSRRFVAATSARLTELLSRPLDGQRFLVVYLDGFGMGEHLLVGALGVTADGTKVPLGVAEGTTENAAVVGALITDLRERGLDASAGLLFVIDGGKALRAAIRQVFGTGVPVQRCRRHKERNVTEHLPEVERPLLLRRLRAAWAEPDPARAKGQLEAIARGLAHRRPGAAAALREGLAETLTVNRLGVSGSLLRTLESTNPIESMIEIVRDHATRVKHWESGEMALRWAAAGMLAAQGQFRRVRGFAQLPLLAAALRREVGLPEREEVAIA
jgi:putative transposase